MTEERVPVSGEVWRWRNMPEIPQVVEKVDAGGFVWVRSFAFLNGFPMKKFLEMYEPAA